MARTARQGQNLALALLPAALVGACLVKDVELVDRLPGDAGGSGGNTSTAGSPSGAGKTSSGDGGEDAAAGDGSGGTQPSAGSDSGGQAGAMSPGGTGGAPGGSAGMNQGGSEDPITIPDLQSCPDPNYFLCDNFEAGAADEWQSGPVPKVIADAPSGEHVLAANFVPERLALVFQAVKVSFWVRLENMSDQPFLSFFSNNQDKVQLGLEESRLRWTFWLASTQENGLVRIPQNNAAARLLPIGSWFCVEVAIQATPKVLDARVVIPGATPFVMPTVDGDPSAGIDDQWNMNYNWGVNSNAGLFFGIDGAYQEFDDVMIGAFDQKTLCELYEESL
jgi:hypothetical protein